MKKRLLFLLFALLMIFGAACGSGEGEGSASTADTATETQAPAAVDPAAKDTLRVTVFDFGKADCILLSLGDEHILIDASYKSDGDAVIKALSLLGVSKLKYAVATHPDKDHIGGMAKVIKKLTVQNLYVSPFEEDSGAYENMMEAAKKINVTVAKPGDILTLGGAMLATLAPGADALAAGDENNASIVLKLTYRGATMLFMGDAKAESEADMLERYGEDILKADVIKIGHHGRSDATSKSFLEAVKPKYAVISTANADGETLPAPETLKRLADAEVTVYSTSDYGKITLYTDGENWSIYTEY